MPWNFFQTPRVNHLRYIPTTHGQEPAETKDADTHPSILSLEGNKELEYMLMVPNDEAQERRISCNQSASSSTIGESLLSSFASPFWSFVETMKFHMLGPDLHHSCIQIVHLCIDDNTCLRIM
mgnify:FL=1